MRDLVAYLFVSSILLESPDDNRTKIREQYLKCGNIKALKILTITSGGMNLRTLLTAATLTLTLLHIDLTWALKDTELWLHLVTSYGEPPPGGGYSLIWAI